MNDILEMIEDLSEIKEKYEFGELSAGDIDFFIEKYQEMVDKFEQEMEPKDDFHA